MSNRSHPEGATYGSPLMDQTAEWLVEQALGESDVGQILAGCCERLLAAGVPLSRAYLGYRTLHPLFSGISLVWRRGQALGTYEHLHESAFLGEEWLRSPLYFLRSRELPFLRRRLTGNGALLDFLLLEELREQGATDYLAFQVSFMEHGDLGPDAQGLLGSWCTDRIGGFSDQDIRDLVRIQRRMAVACKVQIKEQVAQNVLNTYLGMDAGRKVLAGQIRRGDGEQIHAVLWFSDMRDSTRLADVLESNDFLSTVNTYFECTAGAVLEAGGEVLRFIGDAVLAIFPIADDVSAAQACSRALAAAADSRQRMIVVNEERKSRAMEPIEYGLGLHVGDVMYGNIGVAQRLEFSVVGAAANEAARLEGLTKVLGHNVLLSEEFVTRLPGPYRPLGQHKLRGVGVPVEVFEFNDRPSL
ncbi:MAG: adenylate cyclase [Gammaproteobacteria bacterium]|jgi:adenylate cyclase